MPVTIEAAASDPSPGSGVKEVRFYFQHCPNEVCESGERFIGADTTSPYAVAWSLASCPVPAGPYYRIRARAEDNCGNVSANDSVVFVRVEVCPYVRGQARTASTASWVSTLSVAGGRGQVVVDGTDAVFPAGGVETFTAAAAPGTHRFEATLVEGAGRPGAWRFDLSALGAVPGSLRVVAGEAELAGSAAVVFRLRGKPGERVVFSVDVGAGQ
jgi:hypothetical protein